jgi:adenylate cyclase 1
LFGGETSQSEWSEEDDDDDDEGAASEPLLADRESTGYTTDDPALENVSMLNETGLTDAEGKSSHKGKMVTGEVVRVHAMKACRGLAV